MQVFEIEDLRVQQAESGKRYFEFVRSNDLSAGVYRLPSGGVDPQAPHTEDELYYVISGKAILRVAEDDRPVQAGSVIFVGKNVAHKFHSITEELTVLVFFAPAERSASGSQ